MILRSVRLFVFVFVSLLSGCGGSDGAAPSMSGSTSATPPGIEHSAPNLSSLNPSSLSIDSAFFSPQNFGVSQKVAATQGYATDGRNNFLFSTQSIVQTDSQWNVVYTNSAPFSGISIHLTHIGDGEVGGGKIYAPLACNTQQKCSPEAVAIGVYSADTADLPFQQWVDISSSGCDGSGIAVGPHNTLYVSSFYVNPDVLCLYDATTLESKGTLKLSTPIPGIQGISFDQASQRFAVTADDAAKKVGYIYFVSLDGEVVGPAYTVPQTGELEGLDFTQGYIGYVIQPFDYVYFLYPIQVTGRDFYPVSTVEVDGAAQQTTYENSELLDAIVPASSLHSFGQAQVTVVNPSPGGGTSSALPFNVKQSE
jgi:hypothetical protein